MFFISYAFIFNLTKIKPKGPELIWGCRGSLRGGDEAGNPGA